MKRSLVIASSAIVLLAAACAAQSQEKPKISDGVVKIGMIEDMSSIYADITGLGAVTAAKMAVEDFGGTVLGMPRSSPPTTRTRRTLPRLRRANGSRTSMSTR
jgi:branched-chain amino acid transport system substrate-binding protein